MSTAFNKKKGKKVCKLKSYFQKQKQLHKNLVNQTAVPVGSGNKNNGDYKKKHQWFWVYDRKI